MIALVWLYGKSQTRLIFAVRLTIFFPKKIGSRTGPVRAQEVVVGGKEGQARAHDLGPADDAPYSPADPTPSPSHWHRTLPLRLTLAATLRAGAQ